MYMYTYCGCTMYIFSCTYTCTENIVVTQCACIHVHVSYYGHEGTFGPCACIQLIRVICVDKTRKEYCDTNEMIQSGNIIR